MREARLNAGLASVAIALGVAAALAGTRPVAPAVDVVQLAEWIRNRHPLTVVDLRDADAFAQFRIPTSRQVPVDALDTLTADTLVLVDGGDGTAAETARRLLPRTVYWVEGGAEAWARDLLNATIAEGAPDAAFAAFARTALLSRYFGGTPRIVPAGGDTTGAGIGATVRRGCGF